jgi:hypothetical protein
MSLIRKIVSDALQKRQEYGINVRQPLASLSVRYQSIEIYHWKNEQYQQILKDEVNVKEVKIGFEQYENGQNNIVELDTNITEDLKNEGEMAGIRRSIQDMRKSANLVPSDVVTVSLITAEPAWFNNNQTLTNELLTTVGAREIVWGEEVDKVEKI